MSNTSEPTVEHGITYRSIIALLFALFVVQPALIYYSLITNSPLALQAWIVILLWSELSRFFATKISKQELFIISSFQSFATQYAFSFVILIKNMYYGTTEVVKTLGLAEAIPSWWAPRPEVAMQLYMQRWLFIDNHWIAPIVIFALIVALGVIANISMGYICYEVFVRVEKLPFPAASAQASTLTILAERPSKKIAVLMISAVIGLIASLIGKFIPYMIGPFLQAGGFYVPPAIPMVDFTPYLDQILPGAAFALGGDLLYYVPGLLLPPTVAFAQFLGVFAYYIAGTHLITRMGLWPSESLWSTGWGLGKLIERANLYFFTSVTIGLSIAVVILPLIVNPQIIIRAFSGMVRRARLSESMTEGERPPRLETLLVMYVGSVLGSVLLVKFLIPGFPLWILILFQAGWSFLSTLLITSASGVTYTGFSIPYQRELMIYYSGYSYKDVWFSPVTLFTGGSDVAQSFKMAELLETRKSEYVKAYVFVVVLGLVSSFIYTSLFWSISPMPSTAYPATILNWPVDAVAWARTQKWIWSGYLFRTEWILGGIAAGSAIFMVTNFVLRVPYFLISMIAGSSLFWVAGIYFWWEAPVLLATSQLVGSIFGKKVLARFLGEEQWNEMRGLVVIGYIIGDGFMETLRASIILIWRSMWLLPF